MVGSSATVPCVLRALVVAVAALAFAAPASAFSKRTACRRWTTASRSAFTRYTPDGAAPAAGRPGVLVLHGLAGNRGTVDAVAARSRTPATRCSPTTRGATAPPAARSRSPGRARSPTCARSATPSRRARGQRQDRRLGHLLRRRPDLERARGRRAARRGGGGRDVDVAVRRALAAEPRPLRDRGRLRRRDRGALAARRRIRDDAVQSRNLAPIAPCRRRSAAAGWARSGRRSISSRAGSTSPSTSRRRPPRSRASRARRSCTPATSAMRRLTFPGGTAYACSRRASPGSTAT